MWSPCCLCVCVSPPISFEFFNQSLWNLTCISWHPAYLINLSHQSVCMWIHSIVARQLLGRGVTAARNTHATIEKSLDMRFMSFHRKVGNWFLTEALVIFTLACPVSSRALGPLLRLENGNVDENYESAVSLSARKCTVLQALSLPSVPPKLPLWN